VLLAFLFGGVGFQYSAAPTEQSGPFNELNASARSMRQRRLLFEVADAMTSRAEIKLTKRLIRGLKVISLHGDRFQPIELRVAVRTEVADALVALGLVERSQSHERFAEWDYDIGYRLTAAGSDFLIARRSR
jgi:hypothetical protein